MWHYLNEIAPTNKIRLLHDSAEDGVKIEKPRRCAFPTFIKNLVPRALHTQRGNSIFFFFFGLRLSANRG